MKIDQSWYIKPEGNLIPAKPASGGVVVRRGGKKILVALLKFPEYGDFVLPKGHPEKGENMETAARREIGEETGLTEIELISFLGIKSRLDYEKKEWKDTYYFLFVTKRSQGKQNLQQGENFILKWFSIDRLPEMFWPEQKLLIEENREKIKELLKEK